MKEYCARGKAVYARWIGVGELCLGCFRAKYYDLNKEDPEFLEKQEKIKKNFDENTKNKRDLPTV